MGVCDTREVYYPGAEDAPQDILDSWLATQICPLEDVKNQYCWVDGDYVYFIIHVDTGGGILTQLPPTIIRRILIDDLDRILRNDSDAELYWNIIV